jgi:uncharacterized membrane protein YhaH (DUF805 family)
MDWTWYLFRFDGRINRAKMWLGMLVILCGLMLLSGLLAGAFALLGGTRPIDFGLSLGDFFAIFDPAAYRSLAPAPLAVFLFKAASSAVLLWIGFAIAVKRLHDRDKSGWWIVPFFVVPGLYNTFGEQLPNIYVLGMMLAAATFLLYLWGFIELYCLKGSRKTNRFGADPLATSPPSDTRPPWDQQSEIEMVPKAGPPPVWRVKPMP